MEIVEYTIIAIALAMDAFAVAIGKGLSVRRIRPRHALCVGAWFGGFQALMPVVGYLLGSSFASVVKTFDHWIAFGLLLLIGGNMIKESFGGDDDDDASHHSDFSWRVMLPLAVATSIDALAVGISFAFLGSNIWVASPIIGVVTAALSVAGLIVGNIFGRRHRSKAELVGGVTLILIGIKILVEHLSA